MRLHAIAPTRLRAVTHLDVDAAGIDRAIAAVRAALLGLTAWTRPPKRPSSRSDAEQLKRLGYAQELRRRMGAFSNFAISFSTICILAGGITSLQLGVCAVGGAAAGIVWPVGVVFSLIVALCMAEVASAFPDRRRALSLERDPRRQGLGLGDRLVQPGRPRVRDRRRQRRRLPAVRATSSDRCSGSIRRSSATGHQIAGVALISLSHALLNHFGIRADDAAHRLQRLADLRRRAAADGRDAARRAATSDVGRLFTFATTAARRAATSGRRRAGLGTMTLLALMWPIYTITGFDASAHTSEETVQAAHNVPKGILRSVYVSGLVGWVMVASFVLAMPDVAEGARQGGDVFSWLMERVLPGAGGRALWVGIVLANYLCGLACMTSTSRMMYAFARDGGLPGSSRAQARVAALADAGAGDLDDRGAGARVDAVCARVLDADDRVRDLPVSVVRDADARRAARVRTDVDARSGRFISAGRSTRRSPSCRCWARRCSSGSACSRRTRRR